MRTAKIAALAVFIVLAVTAPAAADTPADSPKQPDPLFEEFICPAGTELMIPDMGTRFDGRWQMFINEDGKTVKFCNGQVCLNGPPAEIVFARCEPYS